MEKEKSMTNKEIRTIAIYLIMFGLCTFALGRSVGVWQQMNKYNNLKDEYFELEKEYNILEIQYKRDLESCYTQFGDYQDKVEAGCFVNGGWNCE